jgi:hypothetical protein
MLRRPHSITGWTALLSAGSLAVAVALTPLWLPAAQNNHGSVWLAISLWLVFLALMIGLVQAIALSVAFYRPGLLGQIAVALGFAVVPTVAALLIALDIVQNQIGVVFVAAVLFVSFGTYLVLINLAAMRSRAIAPLVPQIGIVCGGCLLVTGLMTLIFEIAIATMAAGAAILAYGVWSVLLATDPTLNRSPSSSQGLTP